MPSPLISGGPLKSVVFGSRSSLPTLVGGGDGLVCESVGKADQLSELLTATCPRSLLICHPSPNLITFTYRSYEFRLLLLYMDYYGGTDPLSMFPLCHKRTADVPRPRLSLMFRRLVRVDSFPAYLRRSNVTRKGLGTCDALLGLSNTRQS